MDPSRELLRPRFVDDRVCVRIARWRGTDSSRRIRSVLHRGNSCAEGCALEGTPTLSGVVSDMTARGESIDACRRCRRLSGRRQRMAGGQTDKDGFFCDADDQLDLAQKATADHIEIEHATVRLARRACRSLRSSGPSASLAVRPCAWRSALEAPVSDDVFPGRRRGRDCGDRPRWRQPFLRCDRPSSLVIPIGSSVRS